MGKASMLKDFKEFAFKGNLIDMAVGIIIGGAFGTVVKSLVDNVFMPPLGMMIAGIDFKRMKIVLKEGVPAQIVDGQQVAPAIPEAALNYGQFITDFIAFVLLAFAVYLVVKKALGVLKREPEVAAPRPPSEPSAEEKLLAEIRDLLKQKA
ncbi:MAG: large-conductance mechanosensitive channel protein MscL [Verrucomicrobiota bacterium]